MVTGDVARHVLAADVSQRLSVLGLGHEKAANFDIRVEILPMLGDVAMSFPAVYMKIMTASTSLCICHVTRLSSESDWVVCRANQSMVTPT